jgi:hypothetical protein
VKVLPFALAFCGLATGFGQVISKRAPKIAHLPPGAFPELPVNIAKELKRRHCSIPQFPHTVDVYERQNVIKGEFARLGQKDWAVLCSTKNSAKILVFWNGLEANPSESEVGFDPRLSILSPVARERITAEHEASGGPELPPIDHQGIVFSTDTHHTILYYFGGKWITLSSIVDRIY